MYAQVVKPKENKSLSVDNAVSQKQGNVGSVFQFVDNRPEAIAQRKLQDMANNSPQSKQATRLQAMTDNNSVKLQRPIQKTGLLLPSVQKDGAVGSVRAPGEKDTTGTHNGVIGGVHEQESFLEKLHAAVCKTAGDVLGPSWSASSCPQLRKIFEHYAMLSHVAVERIMQRYSGVSGASKADDYIAPICARIRGAIRRWGTGNEDLSWDVGSSGLPVALESNHSTHGEHGKVQLKRKAGTGDAARDGVAPEDLGPGVPINSGMAAIMGKAFGGERFDDVRIHTESAAAQKTRDLGADAMAVGSHVAFAHGEYLPGTRSGDSLIAHELAHVIQQRGSEQFTQRRAVGVEPSGTPQERDADLVASGVVARLHPADTGGETATDTGAPIRPALTSGLGVRRGNKPPKEEVLNQAHKDVKKEYTGPSEEEKARAISEAYDKLALIGANIAKKKLPRFNYWRVEEIVKDFEIDNWIKPAMSDKEGENIVLYLVCFEYVPSVDSAHEAILDEPKKREIAQALARAADRRFVGRLAVSDSDLAYDQQQKKRINEFCDQMLLDHSKPINGYDEQRVAAVVKGAREKLITDHGMMLSMNLNPVLQKLDKLVETARKKGYPLEDQHFVNSLVEIAIACYFIGTSGSVNADHEEAGGDQARSRR